VNAASPSAELPEGQGGQDASSLPLSGKPESDHCTGTNQERIVHIYLDVGWEYYHSIQLFGGLKQAAVVLVGIPIVDVSDTGPLAGQHVSFIKEKTGLLAISPLREVGEILYRLADLL
jgi:hypothetical protein